MNGMAGKRWTDTEIKDGFDQFNREYGRYPTALEIDQYPHLPTARQFQRRFGGLRAYRKENGHEISDFGKGAIRAKVALEIAKRGRKSELALEESLTERFGEMFVHVEKRFGISGHRVDCFVYSPDGNFGVDVFNAGSPHSLQGNINIKLSHYLGFPSNTDLFFLCVSEAIDQNEIDRFVGNKRQAIPKNIQVVTLETFEDLIKNRGAFPSPSVPTKV